MRLHRFFVNEMVGGRAKIVISDEDLLHQWKKVFRLASGDNVIIFDGSGNDYECKIVTISKDRAELAVGASRNIPAIPKDVWLFIALIKKDHFEWVVEKGTELGVSHFVPILAERSEKKYLNMERLAKIAKEASEQSGRGTVPEIHAVMSLEDAIVGEISSIADDISSNMAKNPPNKIVFDPNGVLLTRADFENKKPAEPVALFIGPEGGWSEDELALFASKKVSVKSMGQQILRAETAAIASATLFLLN
ncbi:16S rRNA (uracil(1498)-N(3))-methyltransferase [Candidatus Parcubacteria bacterium]|nr:16S rRNA (uracil(1498)-N(3))-methyltransferase [Candidatus Parcubacteria bacterium]